MATLIWTGIFVLVYDFSLSKEVKFSIFDAILHLFENEFTLLC